MKSFLLKKAHDVPNGWLDADGIFYPVTDYETHGEVSQRLGWATERDRQYRSAFDRGAVRVAVASKAVHFEFIQPTQQVFSNIKDFLLQHHLRPNDKVTLNEFGGGNIDFWTPEEAIEWLEDPRPQDLARKAVLAADDIGNARQIIDEMMPILPPGMPKPEVKVVNQMSSRWLGETRWKYGEKNGQTWWEPTTTLVLQKRILGHDETLRRVIAHELCHHWEALEYEAADLKKMGFRTFEIYRRMRRAHGAQWKEFASIFNSRYGKDYVTEKSDEAYVEDYEKNLHPYFLLLHQMPNGHVHYQMSMRLSPKQKKWLQEHAGHPEYRLVQTKDPAFINGLGIASGAWSYARSSDTEKTEKLKALWAGAPTTGIAKTAWDEIEFVEREAGKEEATGDLLGGVLENDKELEAWALEWYYDAADFMQMFKGKKVAVIDDINAYWRGQGIGNKLLAQFEAEARRKGCAAIALFAGIKAQQEKGFDLVEWYRRHGFKIAGHSTDFPLMVKWLKKEASMMKRAEHCAYGEDKKCIWCGQPFDPENWRRQCPGRPGNKKTAGTIRLLYCGMCENEALALVQKGSAGQLRLTDVYDEALKMAQEAGCHTVVAVRSVPEEALIVDPQGGTRGSIDDELDGMAGPGHVVLTKPLPASHFSIALRDKLGALRIAKATAKHATTQINFPKELAWKVRQIAREFIPESDLMADGYEDNLHVTVKYGVEENEDKMIAAVKGQMPFEVKLGKTHVFPPSKSSDGAAVVVIDIDAPEMKGLHDKIDKAMSVKEDDFDWHPHATLAYVKPEDSSKYEGLAYFEGVEFEATNVTMSKKDHIMVTVDFGKVKEAAARKKFYHGTSRPFEPGDILMPNRRIEYPAVEAFLEWKRPESMLPRKSSVFMTSDPEEALQWGPDIYEVQPIGKVEKNDLSWFDMLIVAEQEGELGESGGIASHYWDGEPHSDTWEYRAPEAKVLRKVNAAEEQFVKASADRSNDGSCVTLAADSEHFPDFPPAVIVRFPQKGLQWRAVLKILKQIAGEVAGRRVPWKDLHVFENPWGGYKEQQEKFPEWAEQKKFVMYDILPDGSFKSVGKPHTPPPPAPKPPRRRTRTDTIIEDEHGVPYNPRTKEELDDFMANRKPDEWFSDYWHRTKMSSERIKAKPGGDWECICGNTSTQDGFYPCDKHGNEVEPRAEDWDGHYVCASCGRIIDEKTRRVIGQVDLQQQPLPLKHAGEEHPSPLYHVSDADFREDILRNGLDPRKYLSDGIFFSTKPAAEPQELFDIWQVDVTGLDIEPDRTTLLDPSEEEYFGAPWWVYWGGPPIPPSRLKLYYEGRKTASHKTPPLDETVYQGSPSAGQETNAYADLPERTPAAGGMALPSLEQLAPQMFEEPDDQPHFKATIGAQGDEYPLPAFEELLEKEGGLYDLGDWDKIEAEARKRVEEWDKLPEAKREEWLDKIGMEWHRREWLKTEKMLRSLRFPLTVYRGICGADLRNVSTKYEHPVYGKGVGIFWSWDEGNAYTDNELVHNCKAQGQDVILLRGTIESPDEVNWLRTSWVNFVLGEEYEINLKPGAAIRVTGWKKRGEAEWQPPTKRLMSVTASVGIPTLEEFLRHYGGLESLSRAYDLSANEDRKLLSTLRGKYKVFEGEVRRRGFPMTVYRQVDLDNIDELDIAHVGVSWTDTNVEEGTFWGGGTGSKQPWILKAQVGPDDIDWYQTMWNRFYPSLGYAESEITLKSGIPVELLGVRQADNGGWMKPSSRMVTAVYAQGQNQVQHTPHQTFGLHKTPKGDPFQEEWAEFAPQQGQAQEQKQTDPEDTKQLPFAPGPMPGKIGAARWPRQQTIRPGTILYRGVPEGRDDYMGAWFSSSPSVANHFAEGGKVYSFKVTRPIKLPLIESKQEFDEFCEKFGIEPYSAEDMYEGAERAGLPGWIIPNNYPDGDDILLTDTSALQEVEQQPAAKLGSVLYRGMPQDADPELKPRSFAGVFFSTDPRAAAQYGKVRRYSFDDRGKLLDIDSGEAPKLVREFLGRGLEDPQDLEDATVELFMFPWKEWADFVRKQGYIGTKIGNDVSLFDLSGVKVAMTLTRLDKMFGRGDITPEKVEAWAASPAAPDYDSDNQMREAGLEEFKVASGGFTTPVSGKWVASEFGPGDFERWRAGATKMGAHAGRIRKGKRSEKLLRDAQEVQQTADLMEAVYFEHLMGRPTQRSTEARIAAGQSPDEAEKGNGMAEVPLMPHRYRGYSSGKTCYVCGHERSFPMHDVPEKTAAKTAKEHAVGQVYLLHFDIPREMVVPSSREDASHPFHARHYLGFAEDAQERIEQHYEGTSGVKLMNALHDKGLTFTVARIWDDTDRYFERRLKSQGGLSRFCPICRRLGLIPASRLREKALKDVQVAPQKPETGPDFAEIQTQN